MNLKAIIRKITSWFKAEAMTIETKVEVDTKGVERVIADQLKALIVEAAARVESDQATWPSWTITKDGIFKMIPETFNEGIVMSTPAATPAVDTNKAVAIALALKAIDASLTVEQVQAATNAALAALQPQVAA
jgi:hypothetical protein